MKASSLSYSYSAGEGSGGGVLEEVLRWRTFKVALMIVVN